MEIALLENVQREDLNAIEEALGNCEKIAVIDKNFSFGIGGALYADMKVKIDKEIYGFNIGCFDSAVYVFVADVNFLWRNKREFHKSYCI